MSPHRDVKLGRDHWGALDHQPPVVNLIRNQKSKKSQKQKKPRASAKKRGGVSLPKYRLSPCVEKYLHARADPFSPAARGACIPGETAVPSFKYSTWAAVSHTATAGEDLYIGWEPNAASDRHVLKFHDVAIGSDPQISLINSGTSTPVLCFGSPFTAASFASGLLEQRLVGASLRLKVTEAPLTAAGSVRGYWPPSCGALLASSLASQWLQLYNTRMQSKAETMNKWFHIDFDIDNFVEAQTWMSSPEVRNNTYFGALGLIKVDASSATVPVQVHVEVVHHWEVRGTTVANFATPNSSEPVAAAKVYNGVANVFREVGNTVLTYPGQMSAITAALGLGGSKKGRDFLMRQTMNTMAYGMGLGNIAAAVASLP